MRNRLLLVPVLLAALAMSVCATVYQSKPIAGRVEYHPHVHLVMPAAAVDAAGQRWRTKQRLGKGGYLFHHKALAKVFRAKLLAAPAAAGLALPARYPMAWVVDCKAAGTGEKALIADGANLVAISGATCTGANMVVIANAAAGNFLLGIAAILFAVLTNAALAQAKLVSGSD